MVRIMSSGAWDSSLGLFFVRSLVFHLEEPLEWGQLCPLWHHQM